MPYTTSIKRTIVIGLFLLAVTFSMPALALAQTADTNPVADPGVAPTTTSIEPISEPVTTSEEPNGVTCTVNGKDVDCKEQVEKIKQYAKPAAIGLFIFLVIASVFSALGFAFWVWMLVHLASNPIKDKVLWVIVLIFGGFIGAVVYFFAEKRPFDARQKAGAPANTASQPPQAPLPPTSSSTPAN